MDEEIDRERRRFRNSAGGVVASAPTKTVRQSRSCMIVAEASEPADEQTEGGSSFCYYFFISDPLLLYYYYYILDPLPLSDNDLKHHSKYYRVRVLFAFLFFSFLSFIFFFSGG